VLLADSFQVKFRPLTQQKPKVTQRTTETWTLQWRAREVGWQWRWLRCARFVRVR